MKLNIGDYVRTKDGRIFQWNQLCTTSIEDFMEHTRKVLYIEDEIKSSPNIIDLIEVGDYVNGRKVYQIGYNAYDDFVLKMSESNYEDFIYQQDIKSIITKEQFESMEYKVGDKE